MERPRFLDGPLSVTSKAHENDVGSSDELERVGRDGDALVTHHPRAGVALIKSNIAIRAVAADQAPLTNNQQQQTLQQRTYWAVSIWLHYFILLWT